MELYFLYIVHLLQPISFVELLQVNMKVFECHGLTSFGYKYYFDPKGNFDLMVLKQFPMYERKMSAMNFVNVG